MIKRRPSECGDWETGCHGAESNNLALIAMSWREFCERLDRLLPRWQQGVQELQRKTLSVDPVELENLSLGWLLANQKQFYDDLCVAAGEECSEAHKERQDPDTIRDWFCWLHREMLSRTKE